jgi:excisionase family DNA binding protein
MFSPARFVEFPGSLILRWAGESWCGVNGSTSGWKTTSGNEWRATHEFGRVGKRARIGPVDPNEILTVNQAARVLKVSYSHVLRLIRGGVNGMPPVHHVRAGRSVRIRRGALTDWIRNVESQSVSSDVQRAWQ